jgi:hypothetical protein
MKTLHLSFDAVTVVQQSDDRRPDGDQSDKLYCNVLGVTVSAGHGPVPVAILTGRMDGEIITNIGQAQTGGTLNVPSDAGAISAVFDEADTLAVLFVVILWNHRGFSNDQARFVYEQLRDAVAAELNARTLVELVQLNNAGQQRALSDAINERVQGPALMNALKTLNLGALTPDQKLGSVARVVSAGDFFASGTTEWEESINFAGNDGSSRNGSGSYRLVGRTVVV